MYVCIRRQSVSEVKKFYMKKKNTNVRCLDCCCMLTIFLNLSRLNFKSTLMLYTNHLTVAMLFMEAVSCFKTLCRNIMTTYLHAKCLA